MIKEQYVSFETAKLAKEKGYNELCCTIYKNGLLKIHKSHNGNNYSNLISNKGLSGKCFSAPTQALLARWLREKHNMCVEVNFTSYGFVWCVRNTNNTEDNYGSGESGPNKNGTWDNYEGAKESGLQEALKFI